MNELVICLFCFVFCFCITLIQGTRTNDILFASFCLSLFNSKIFFFLEIWYEYQRKLVCKWIGYRKNVKKNNNNGN